MLPILRPHVLSKADLSKVDKRTEETKLLSQNTANDADIMPIVSSDVYAPGSMTVCRVCLGMNVRMYHMSEHELRVMYERVTGVEINSEDKLPQKLCWECIARLSSADNFIEKALRTQLILLSKTNGKRSITMCDIKSIDKCQNQLESTLGVRLFKVNEYNSCIIEDAANMNEIDVNINNEEQNITEDNMCDKDAMKSEQLYVKEEIMAVEDVEDNITIYEETDITTVNDETKNGNADTHTMEFTICIKRECMSDEEELFDDESNNMTQEDNHTADPVESSEVCEITQPRWKRRNNTSTPLRNRRSKEFPCSKKQHTVPIMKHTVNEAQTLIKNKIILEDNKIVELLTSTNTTKSPDTHSSTSDIYQTATTSAVNRNNSLIIDDTDPLKTLFICDSCDKSFHQKTTLIQHILKHPNIYNCTYCSYKSHYSSNVSKHINFKHTKIIVFSCSYCDYKAYRKTNLKEHINSQHTKRIWHECSFCSYKTHHRGQLNQHINSQHTKSNIFNCSYCSFKTYRKGNLNEHLSTKHIKSSVFNCSFCSFIAYSKSTLKQHVNSKHTKSSVFNCTYCSFKTCSKNTLDQHINSKHTKSISYDCSYCSYKAYCKNTLQKHLQSKHTEGTVINCSYCSYKTYYKADLNKHVNASHTKSSCYDCTHCSYNTYYRSALAKHIKEKHS